MSARREFDNPYHGYSESSGDLKHQQKPFSETHSKIKDWIEKKLRIIKGDLPSDRDCSVYTGSTGIAYLFYHLANGIFKGTDEETELLNLADSITKSSKKHLSERRITFLCGDAGPLCLGAVLAARNSDFQTVEKNIKKLVSMADRCCNYDNIPDEVLYGRAGFLFGLLFVQQHVGMESVNDSTILKVCDAILRHGSCLAQKDRSRIPLKFVWHDKEYLGAAHGYFGILYMLLQPQLQRHKLIQDALPVIKECIDQLTAMRFPSGNFPSSLGNRSDKLIQWCHGAPGAVYLYTRAFQVFDEEKYLTVARECCDAIWQRGLLQKGYGLCHGVAGNAYAFLALYNITKEDKYLYYANKFGEWYLNDAKHECRTPDRPLSLFEGLAGTIHFMADLLDPGRSHFPAFQL